MKRLTRDILFESDHLSQDLARKSICGGITTMTSQGAQFVFHLVGTIVLARLLTPSDYGLIGMVMVIITFAGMFKDAGLSMATVQKDNISHEQISTLFWLNFHISILLGLSVSICSPLVAWFYGKPELTAVTAVLSLSFLINGMTIQHQALLRRHMQFGVLAFIQIASYIVNIVVTIFFAMVGLRYWALVAGSLVYAFSITLGTFFFCPWIPGQMKKGTGVRSMLKFGGHLTGFNFVHYFSRNSDNILIGKFIGAEGLGTYAKAYQLFMMPIMQIRVPLKRVAIPILSSLKNQPDRYTKYYRRLVDSIATLAIPLTLYCAIEADFLIRVFLGQQWLSAVSVFRILSIAALIEPIAGSAEVVIITQGFSNRYFWLGLFTAVLTVLSFVVGLPFGIEGVAAAYSITAYVILFPSLFYCFHKTPVTVSLFIRTIISPMLVGMFAAACIIMAKQCRAGESLISHVIYLGVFIIVYSVLSCFRPSVREILRPIRKGLTVIFMKDVKAA